MTDASSETTLHGPRSVLSWLKARVLPQMPDFYAMLIEQCGVTTKGTHALAQFFSDGDAANGIEVRRLEHEGDRIKASNLETLHRSFATPMDREDFYDAIIAIDEILNYAKTSVREVEILEVAPDPQMAEMADLIDKGAQALLEGFRHLKGDPAAAGSYAEIARKTERATEKAYRRALAMLFDPEQHLDQLVRIDAAGASRAGLDQRSGNTLVVVTQILKHREIYRHLSNSSDHIAHAAQVLEDIVNKAS